jgi:hypothetical protein
LTNQSGKQLSDKTVTAKGPAHPNQTNNPKPCTARVLIMAIVKASNPGHQMSKLFSVDSNMAAASTAYLHDER